MRFVMVGDRVVHFLYDCAILYELVLFNVELLVKIVRCHNIVSNCNKLISSRPCSKMKYVKFMLDSNSAQELHHC